MTTKKKIIFVLAKLLSLLLFVHLSSTFVLGQVSTAQSVSATVKISICGNNIAEGGEDCDNTDLGGETCIALGYTSGILSCDIACDFNTLGCSNTPDTTDSTETSTSEQTATSTLTTPITTTPVLTTPIIADTHIISSPITRIPPTIPSVSIIPPVLKFFDLDESGRIEATEVFTAVKSWVDEWRETLIEEIAIAEGEIFEKQEIKKCDINNDDMCNLADFSILLFYVQN